MNFYAVIPAIIITSKDLSSNEKILYGIISAMTNKMGYCYATNKALSEYFEKNGVVPHVNTISKWVNKLIKLKHLQVEIYDDNNKQERRLRLSDKVVVKEVIKKETPEVTSVTKDENYGDQVTAIMSYLNLIVDRSFSHTTKNSVTNIVKLLKLGKTIEDFQKVIESARVNQWYIDHPQYYAPTTLFREDKFEAHLAAWTFEIRESIFATIETKQPKIDKKVSKQVF